MIKVLFLAADPGDDRPRLRLDEEVRAIDEAIRLAAHRDTVEFVIQPALRIRDLQNVLRRHKPQILHFAGHGDEAGGIVLGNEYGEPVEVDREALNQLFGILEHPPRVVVLNACATQRTAEVAGNVVDYTIGMNRPVQDASARVFAASFYGALADGDSVERAFQSGVSQLRLEKNPEADIPALHVRPGVVPGVALVQAPDGDEKGVERVDAEPEMIFANVLNSGRPGSMPPQVQSFRDPSGRIVTYRNG
jgi:CHAT domain-containing protein